MSGDGGNPGALGGEGVGNGRAQTAARAANQESSIRKSKVHRSNKPTGKPAR